MVKRLSSTAVLPTLKRQCDSGYDLYADQSEKGKILNPGDIVMIPTGIAIEIPEGDSFILKERGSTGSKGLALRCGVVDSSYRGEIFICLNNTSNKKIFLGTNEEVEKYANTLIMETDEKEVNDKNVIKDKNFIFYDIKKAIAQGLIIPVKHYGVQKVDDLTQTERGEGKLGSSGK